MRNLYSSSLYTNITSSPQPISLPKSFRLLVENIFEKPYLLAMPNTASRINAEYNRFSVKNCLVDAIRLESLNDFLTSKSIKSYSRCLDIMDESQENATFTTHNGKQDVILFFETYNSLGSRKDYDFWIGHLLPLFGNRVIYSNNEEPMLGLSEMVKFQRNTFYTELASNVLRSLYSSGIQQYLDEIILPSKVLTSILKHHSLLRMQLNISVIFSSYARMYIERQNSQSNIVKSGVRHVKCTPQNTQMFASVNFKDTLVCWWIYVIFLSLSIVVFFVECLVSKSKTNCQTNSEIPMFVYLK